MVLICLFDLWGELGPGIYNFEATPLLKKKNRGGPFTIVVPTLAISKNHLDNTKPGLKNIVRLVTCKSNPPFILLDQPRNATRSFTETWIERPSSRISGWAPYLDRKINGINQRHQVLNQQKHTKTHGKTTKNIGKKHRKTPRKRWGKNTLINTHIRICKICFCMIIEATKYSLSTEKDLFQPLHDFWRANLQEFLSIRPTAEHLGIPLRLAQLRARCSVVVNWKSKFQHLKRPCFSVELGCNQPQRSTFQVLEPHCQCTQSWPMPPGVVCCGIVSLKFTYRFCLKEA